MLHFLLKRLTLMIPTLLGVTVVVFLMLQIVPGDPVNTILPPDASQADRQKITEELGLNKPLYIQYFSWLFHILQGDLGRSIIKRIAVNQLMFEGLWNTFILALAAGVLAFSLSIVVGVYSAYNPKSWTASMANMIGLTGVAIPNFWVALILIGIFSVLLGWLPPSGMKNIGGGGIGDLLTHLILPAVAAGMTTLGVMTRMIRSTVYDLLHQDFVTTLKAKGAKSSTILLHVLKNGTPTILTVAGLQFGYLLGGSVLVETVFSWPGVGQLIYQAISQRDFPVIQAGVLIIAVMFVCLNVIVDLVHGLIDPRIRHT
ncbi:ABC transporter permease [Paenibacillus sp. GP183]|jgi:peptide/nickel transport system permease protein|uniref:ABC transporter permease n=1 Tax=Paenibacillus sp. GP183 TaxID=1882751 RepID=UPI000899FDFF|nr:ABC transporter permease [Paenibacillus sp. GP183]SEB72436.1 peptide/nickel transport system permease protein [Paenibacillus sp. GP183]